MKTASKLSCTARYILLNTVVKYLMASEQTTEYGIHFFFTRGYCGHQLEPNIGYIPAKLKVYNGRLGFIGTTLTGFARSLVALRIRQRGGHGYKTQGSLVYIVFPVFFIKN